MLGWILLGALFTGVAVGVIIIVAPHFDKKTAKTHLKKNKVKMAWVKDIVKSDKVVHIDLDGLDEDGNSVEIQVTTDNYDEKQIIKGIMIYG